MIRLSSIRCSKQLVLSATLTILFLVGSSLGAQANPIRIESGLISGTALGEDKAVRVYKGIPYAAPPVGDLRWKPPQPVAPWKGVRDCTEFGTACPQGNMLQIYGLTLPEMSEDCLFLNVWTGATSPAERLPVMVWIHGGGNSAGWSHQPSYEGEAFARRGIVLVTINYRLGLFGFFAHPLLSKESEHKVSGNYGILDQIASLRWVQKNIAAFGGDPDCVTIFGESAGGMDVIVLCVSPLSRGLFHRAIIQSGSAIWSMNHLRRASPTGESSEANGESLANELVGEDVDDVLAALRAIPAEKLVEKIESGLRFGPTVDGWVMTDYPANVYKKGLQHDVPLLAGTNADEGSLFALRISPGSDEGRLDALRQRWGKYADEIMAMYPTDTAEQKRDVMNRFLTDTMFLAPTRATVRAMSTVSSNAYLYQFTREQQTGRLKAFGAFHGSEIPYVFNSSGPTGLKEEEVPEIDRKLATAMITYWAQFAKTGDPNGNGLPEWPVYDAVSDQHLELGETIKIGSGLRKEACDVLDRIVAARLRDLEGSK